MQKQGVGTALVSAGNARLRDQGEVAVFVVGEPAYYERFGFQSPLAAGIANPFGEPYFMALELAPHALHGVKGSADYPRAFGI
jgi:putative acetyltransferase